MARSSRLNLSKSGDNLTGSVDVESQSSIVADLAPKMACRLCDDDESSRETLSPSFAMSERVGSVVPPALYINEEGCSLLELIACLSSWTEITRDILNQFKSACDIRPSLLITCFCFMRSHLRCVTAISRTHPRSNLCSTSFTVQMCIETEGMALACDLRQS